MRKSSKFMRLIGAVILVSILLCTTSCIAPICYHDWVSATCDSAKYCTICGITDGKALIHMGGKATCSSLAVCRYCGEGYGEYDAHKYNAKNLSETVDESYHYFFYIEHNARRQD